MKIRRHFSSYLAEYYFPTFNRIVVAWFSFLIPAKQFLGRILLTLLPLLVSMFTIGRNEMSLTSVPYTTAMDIFNGISVCVLFLTLLYVIICEVQNNKKKDEVCLFMNAYYMCIKLYTVDLL